MAPAPRWPARVPSGPLALGRCADGSAERAMATSPGQRHAEADVRRWAILGMPSQLLTRWSRRHDDGSLAEWWPQTPTRLNARAAASIRRPTYRGVVATKTAALVPCPQ